MAHHAQPYGFLGFLLVFASASAFAAATAPVEMPASKPDAPRERSAKADVAPKMTGEKPVRTGIAGHFLSGRFARQNQDIHKAAKYINESLAQDPANLRLRQEALRLNLLAGNSATAITLARKLADDKENDPLIASLLMLDAVKAGDYTKARGFVTAAPGTGLFGLIRPVMLEWLAVGAQETKRPVNMQAAIDKAGFFAPFLTYHSALMNDVLGHQAEAEAAYLKSTADPATTPYRVVQALANFYARTGRWEDAQRTYDAYAKANPNSSLLPERLVAGAAPKPLVPDAQAGLAEVFFTTASLLFSDDSAQDTFLYLRIALELRPNLAPGQLMLANLYEQVEDYAQAIKVYDAMADGTVFHRRAQIRKALNYEALGDKAKAIEILDGVAKRYPEDATALITKGDLLRDSDDYSGAITAYSAAIKRSEPLNKGDWPLFYARGISHERAGDWASAEADFLKALSFEPNQPDVLNYLGYSWLVMNKNITKAREYLDTAAAARPNDGHILDSVAWAHYLTGDYAYAVEMLERAIQITPDEPAVNDHLGDAYWRTGRQTEARYQWERALTFGPDKETAEQLRTKLEKGLPPVGTAPKPQSANANDTAAPRRQIH